MKVYDYCKFNRHNKLMNSTSKSLAVTAIISTMLMAGAFILSRDEIVAISLVLGVFAGMMGVFVAAQRFS